jgi:glycosyltransferase involved in cell wall biosynthesis/SAM-dependent methyltransferase
MEERYKGQLKVSVIITCYNHGQYLAEAIESVRRQTYQHTEIIVVDDGSTDNTKQVAQSFRDVKYVFQENAGLSAARNRGIDESAGSYLVFLDADDWLYENGLESNVSMLKQNRNCVFVSGGHRKVDAYGNWLNLNDETETVIDCAHYEHLLRGNYIGMHAAVMYRRMIFNEFRFDTTLRACEDYDLYFRITRKYPVCHHLSKIAAYRIHGTNMSGNIPGMLKHVLLVLDRQEKLLRTAQEKAALHLGKQIWKNYYGLRLYQLLWHDVHSNEWPKLKQLILLGRLKPKKLSVYLLKKTGVQLRRLLKSRLPDPALKALHKTGAYKEYTPPPGKINTGDFNRLTPFSSDFGFDRGGPIDRFYIEKFLDENRDKIQGNVLEIGDNEYTLRFGQTAVKQSEILHVDATNQKATYVGDITHIPQIPSGNFDCIILTQTLHLIYDFKSALNTCYRILKPGGCLLMTVPGITPIDRGIWKDYWLWSFTDTAMKKVMTETFNGSEVDIKSYGNVFVASGFLYGMGLTEFPKEALQHHDPGYQVIISVKAIKH